MKLTLRKFLLYKFRELSEDVITLQEKILTQNFTEADTRKLDIAEAELNLIKSVIKICEERNKF